MIKGSLGYFRNSGNLTGTPGIRPGFPQAAGNSAF
jgi:propanediol utilization protein